MEDTRGIVKELANYLKTKYKPHMDKTYGAESKFLLLHCIDFRYPKAIHMALDRIMPGRYDQVVLAGAALAGVIDFGKNPKPHWSETLLEHVGLSITLKHHNIKSILVLEHRTCGAYKVFKLLGENPKQEIEYKAHNKQFQKFAKLVKTKFPSANLYIAGLLLDAAPEDAIKANRPIITELNEP
jgi:hypothetical protein